MSDKQNSKSINSEEINLVGFFGEVFAAIINGVKYIFKGIGLAIVFLLRSWLWISISLIVSAALTFTLAKSLPNVYYSEITIRSNAVPSSQMINYLNRLHTFCKEKNHTAIAESLGIENSLSEKILDIESFWIIDIGSDGIGDIVDYKGNHDIRDTVDIRMIDQLVVGVKTKSPGQLSEVREGLFEYINKNELFNQSNEQRKLHEKELLERSSYEIKQLDSLQRVKYFEESKRRQENNNSQMIFLQEDKTQLLHEDIYSLYIRKQSLETQMAIFDEPATLLVDFLPTTDPINGLKYYGFIIVPASLILCILILIISKNRKNLANLFFGN